MDSETPQVNRSASGPWRVVVVDDHPVFRQAIRDLLREYSVEDVEVVGEATSGEEAIELCRRLHPGLVLMDIKMPGIDGLQATRRIKREFPRTIVLMLTAMEDPDYLLEALRAGASGYVLKDLTSQRIFNAVRRALEGESPLNQELSMQLLHRLLEEVEQAKQEVSASLTPPEGPTHEELEPSLILESLSVREVEVLRHIACGHTNRQIAKDLSIAMSTVKNHVHSVITKLGVSDRTQAAVRAVELGLDLGLDSKNSPPDL